MHGARRSYGEESPVIHERICDGLGFLGIALDLEKNATNGRHISTGPVSVQVIPTDEDAMIARHTRDLALLATLHSERGASGESLENAR